MPMKTMVDVFTTSGEIIPAQGRFSGHAVMRNLILKMKLGVGFRLRQLFDLNMSGGVTHDEPSKAKSNRGQKIVILGIAEKRIALLVDHLLGQESTVIKPLGNYLHHCSSLAGATISGDGRVRLVLDPAGLLAISKSTPTMIRKASA